MRTSECGAGPWPAAGSQPARLARAPHRGGLRGRRRPWACPTAGSALLAVLWLAAGLSAIAFGVATTVRGETERTSTATDATRAYYLATGSVDRAILWRAWG